MLQTNTTITKINKLSHSGLFIKNILIIKADNKEDAKGVIFFLKMLVIKSAMFISKSIDECMIKKMTVRLMGITNPITAPAKA